MEYFSRLLGSRASSSSASPAASSTGAPSSVRSGFLRAVAGIGDSEAAFSPRRGRADGSGAFLGAIGGRTRARTGRKAEDGDDLATTFVTDWESVKSILTMPDQRALHYGITRSDVPLLLERMSDALIIESSSFASVTSQQETTDIPPCMEHLLRSSLLDVLVQLSLPNKPKGVLAETIKFFANLIIALDESFVSRQAVHRPLARLIRGCVGDEDGDEVERLRDLGLEVPDEDDDLGQDDDDDDNDADGSDDEAARRRRRRRTRSRYGRINSVEAVSFEQDLVDLMAHIAARIKSTPEMLLIFFHDRRKSTHKAASLTSSPTTGSPKVSDTGTSSTYLNFLGPDARPEFPLFSYLLRFIHREGRIGELARAGLLNLINVTLAPEAMIIPSTGGSSSSRSSGSASARQALAAYILDSDFADVLGAGLGAAYGLLPTKLVLLRPPAASADAPGSATFDTSAISPTSGEQDTTEVAGASMLGSEGMRLGASSSISLPNMDSAQVEAHFLLDDIGAAAAGSELSDRLRSAGMATSNDPEVQTQVRLLVSLLDFAQDVLATAAESIYRDAIINSTELPEQQDESVASGLTIAIVTAIRSIFLQNVVYPSMLECSDADGSATAVMAYLDVILSVIDDRSVLADVVIGYLVGAEGGEHDTIPGRSRLRAASTASESENGDVDDNVIHLESGDAPGRSSNRLGKKLRRRRSMALRMVAEDSRAASNNRWGGLLDGDGELAFAYNASDDAFGRYTLKDLILSHLEESALIGSSSKRKRRKVSAQARQAALRLLRTVLAEHGRFAMGSLVGCVRDEGATAFPFPTPASLAAFNSLPVTDSGKGANGSSAHTNGPGPSFVDEPQFWPDERPKGLQRLDDDLTTRFAGTYDEAQPWSDGAPAFQDVKEKLSNGGHRPEAANGLPSKPPSGSGAGSISTITLEAHLYELALYSYLVGSLRATEDGNKGNKPFLGIQSSSYQNYLQDATDFMAVESTYLYGLDPASADLPLAPYPHRLTPRNDPLLSTLIHALARYFTHSPESNLLLTGTLAALARCPYRSLEGWLTPRHRRRSVGEALNADNIEEQIRSVGSYLSWSPGWITSRQHGGKSSASKVDGDTPIVLYILLGLAAHVRRYARSIPGFSTYLRERREGLMFVENLNDALGLGGIGVEDEDGTLGFGETGAASGSEPSTPTASASHSRQGGAKSAGTAVVPPSKVPGALVTLLNPDDGDAEDSTGLPAVLYYKTTPPEDAGKPGTTTLPSSATTASSKRRGASSTSARAKASSNRRRTAAEHNADDGGLGSPLPSRDENGSGVMVQPFARHYAETGAIFVGTAAVRLPPEWRHPSDATEEELAGERRRIRFEDDGRGGGGTRQADDAEEEEDVNDDSEEESEDESDEDDHGGYVIDSAPRSGASTLSARSNIGVGPGATTPSTPTTPTTATKGVLKKKKHTTEFVTLSALLDNVVILEQAVMELLAVVQVRRCAGIDAIAIRPDSSSPTSTASAA